jgi:hypothetical protein
MQQDTYAQGCHGFIVESIHKEEEHPEKTYLSIGGLASPTQLLIGSGAIKYSSASFAAITPAKSKMSSWDGMRNYRSQETAYRS